MSKTVTARDGDALCGIAIANGFLNCEDLRPLNSALVTRPLVEGDIVTVPDVTSKVVPKPVDNLHKFTKKNSPPVSLRFVHGSKDKHFLDDDPLDRLNVSNCVTNKDGNNSGAFPSGFGFNAAGHADEDTFKVEIVDPGASGSVKGVLEALKPVKQADGSVQFESITGVPDAALRKIDIGDAHPLDCKQIASGHVAFRSRYMRLVVDKQDHDAAKGQTLLTTDTVDAGDEALEILDQHVRASYEFSRCTASPKCKAVKTVPIGENPQRAKVSVHVLQDPATNAPVVTIDQARKSVLKFVRQLYAQASMGVKILGVRTVPAPNNLIAIADARGAKAKGGKTIQIRVQIGQPSQATFDFDQTVQVVTNAGDAPIDTANALATAINNAFAAATPPFAATATASENPPLTKQKIGSADVLVGDPLTQKISLTVVTSGDKPHQVKIGRITSARIKPDFSNNDAHVGTILERTLVKNYDTGSDRIDLFVVGTLIEPDGSTDCGEAFTPNFASAATGQPISLMVNSALIFAATFTSNNNFHTTAPHEMGHILMDNSHARVATEMMGAGSPVGSNERVVGGPKRISDPKAPKVIAFDSGVNGNPVTMLRTGNSDVIDPW